MVEVFKRFLNLGSCQRSIHKESIMIIINFGNNLTVTMVNRIYTKYLNIKSRVCIFRHPINIFYTRHQVQNCLVQVL